MPLFEVAILETAVKHKGEEDKPERLVLPPTCVLAKDTQAAAMKVVMEKRDLTIDFDRMQVIVRPFA